MAPAGRGELARLRPDSSIPSETVVEPHALALGLLEHRAEPGQPLVPPVPEQLRVERAAEQAAAARAWRRRAPRSRARARARAPAPRRGRRAAPRCSRASGRGRCGPSSCGSRRPPGSRRFRSRPATRSPSRSAPPPGPAPWRPAGGGRSPARRSGPRRRRARRARRARARAPEGTRTRAARSRRASRRSARGGRRCRWPPAGGRPASVAISGSSAVGRGRGPELHAAPARRRPAPGRGRAPRSAPPRACSRRPRGAPRRPAAARPRRPARRVLRVDRRAHLAQEAQVAIAGVAPHRVELVAEHRREPERDRHAVDQLEQRQVDARDGLPQPLLAERPRAEALDVRHVRVEHDRQRARPRLRPPLTPAPGWASGRPSTARRGRPRGRRPMRRRAPAPPAASPRC